MLRILTVLMLSTAFGLLLAVGTSAWPLRPGLVGLGAILLSAWLARHYWSGMHPEKRTGSPERLLWHSVATSAIVLGHLSATIGRLGPTLDMHSLHGHALAIDNWTLVLGAVLSYWIARDPEPRQDERDTLIRVQGLRVAHNALLAMLLVLVLLLGFSRNAVILAMNHAMLAHLVIVIVLVTCLVQDIVRLHLYHLDGCGETSDS
jgi:hypothetical protein